MKVYDQRLIKNNEFEVIGSGMVILFDASNLHNNEEILKEGTPMSMSNPLVHILSNGDHYNIEYRMVKVLPIDANFV